MDTRIARKRKIFVFVLVIAVAVLCVMAFYPQIAMARGEKDEKNESRPDITIEVVEDIPAADIEEQEIPLAESPDTAAADNTRQAINIWILSAVVIAYVVFILSGIRRRKARR